MEDSLPTRISQENPQLRVESDNVRRQLMDPKAQVESLE
jgi:hypothetical protein